MIEQDTTINISWHQAVLQARKYLPFAEEFYPQYVDELMGIAEGSGADLGDVLTLNTMEAITSDALFLKCTSLAVLPPRFAMAALLLSSQLGNALLSPLPLVALSVAYHDLRVEKEGLDTATLARVFE